MIRAGIVKIVSQFSYFDSFGRFLESKFPAWNKKLRSSPESLLFSPECNSLSGIFFIFWKEFARTDGCHLDDRGDFAKWIVDLLRPVQIVDPILCEVDLQIDFSSKCGPVHIVEAASDLSHWSY